MNRLLTLATALILLLGAGTGYPYDPVTEDPSEQDAAHPARLGEDVAIASAGARMNGIVYVAQGPGPHPTAVILHGFPGYERNLDLAQAIRRAGWNVLFFHYRGMWGSGGEFSVANELEDVQAALTFLRSDSAARDFQIDAQHIALVGHSLGGALALLTAARDPSVRCVAGLAAVNYGTVAKRWGTDTTRANEIIERINKRNKGGGPVHYYADGKTVVEDAVRNAEQYDLLHYADALAQHPVLLVAGTRDSDAPIAEHYEPLVQALESKAGARLTKVLLESDHAFSDRRIALARAVIAWLNSECHK